MKSSTTKIIVKKALIILFWLVVWEGCAFFANNSIILVGPLEVVKALFKNLATVEFYKSALGSLLRIGLGFSAAFLLGVFLGAVSYCFSFTEEMLAPVVSAIKSVPVASFVVLLLLLAGSENLAFFISLLIVFPNIYINSLEGLKNTDKRMLEMADAFDFGFLKRVLFIYKESLFPYLRSALKVSLGMAWKSGVAAEVIGLPKNSIGDRIYMSKIYIDTADLFAWTIVVILLSFITEKVVIKIVDLISQIRWKPIIKGTFKEKCVIDIDLKDICVSFEERKVIDHLDLLLKKGETYCIMGPSGCGKTTLLKEVYKRSSMKKTVMFQEDRLLENCDAITNICLGSNSYSKEEVETFAGRLLPQEQIKNKVSTFSGGMKRRVALLRTLVRQAEIVILDEPFTGLDEDTKDLAIKLIKEMSAGSTVVVVTHDEEDAKKLGGQKIWMNV